MKDSEVVLDAVGVMFIVHAGCTGGQGAGAEPLLSGFECTPADMAATFKPHAWSLLELLSPK